MRTIHTGGISYIQPVPGGTAEWYYGIDHANGDLYDAEDLMRAGKKAEGNDLCLIRYPEGTVFHPVPQTPGVYMDTPVFTRGSVCFVCVDFIKKTIRILRFDCETAQTTEVAALPLACAKNCYNLQLHVSPLCLTRQGNEGVFEILWPETARFPIAPQESFFLRDGDTLYFTRWHETGEGETYRYWEETVAKDLAGNEIKTMPGDLTVMPNGEIWHFC